MDKTPQVTAKMRAEESEEAVAEDMKLVSDKDVQDILDIFKLADLDAVYIHLGLEERDIEEPHRPQEPARKLINLWRNRKSEAATRGAMIRAMMKCPDCKRAMDKLKEKWESCTDHSTLQVLSDKDVQDILDIFKLANLDAVYIHLGLEEKDIENAKEELLNFRLKERARKHINLWRNRRSEAATRGAVIKAMMKCPDCKRAMDELKKKWESCTEDSTLQVLSDKDVQDILDIFNLADLDAVYIQLGLEERDIDEPHRPQEWARKLINLWRNRRSEAATRGAMIRAMMKCPDCKRAMDELKKKWGYCADDSTEQDQSSFDVDACRNQLMEEYRQTRGKLTLLPGMPEECADMDDLYIELDLLEEEKTPTEVKIKRTLKSADELYTLQNKRGKYCKRILVRGGPGSGKSTTISKLAYDWAHGKVIPGLPYEIDLLFALDLREILMGPNLIDAIHDQLLPKCSKNKLMSYIESHAKSIVFLLDGFDEATDVLQQGDIKRLLSSQWFQESIVIVTTRINNVAEFVNTYGVYSHIQLTGLSDKHMKEYVLSFLKVQSHSKNIQKIYSFSMFGEFGVSPECPTDIKEKMQDIVSFLNILVSSFQGLCQTPLTLSMLCLMWSEDKQLLTQKITELYNGAIMHLAEHKQAKYVKTVNDESLNKVHLNNIMKKIGKVALDGLFKDQLIFISSEFDEHTITDACHFGLLSMERKRSKSRKIQQVTFFHKTFQEYCAAIYWSSLIENDKCIFMSYLEQIDTHNVHNMKILLQFCCGSSCKAAEIILPHIVKLSCDMLQSKPLSKVLLPGDSRLDIPTALLYETGAQHMHRHLLPIFKWQSSSLAIRFKSIFVSVSDIDVKTFLFFLDCVQHDAESLDSFYKGVTEVILLLTDEPLNMYQIFFKLLSCISKLLYLVIEPIRYGSIIDIDSFFNALVGYDMSCKKLITSLVLKNWPLIPTHVLQEMVTFMNQLTSLNTLRFDGLYLSDIEYILNALDSGKVIYKLYIRPNDKDDSVTSTSLNGTFSQTMCQLLPTLHKLTITGNLKKVGISLWCEQIFSAFNTVGCQLLSNQASTNRTISNDAVDREVDMDQPVSLPCKQLILEWVEITSIAAGKLVEAFDYLGNLQVLSIKEAKITDDMGAMIGKNVHKLYNLEVFSLSDNDIGSNGGSQIVRNLGCYISGLQQLDLSSNPIGDGLDPDSSSSQCLSYLTKLTQLDLGNTKLNAGHMLQLGASLTHMPELKALNLESNQIGAAVGDLCLPYLTKLVQLDLSRTGLSEENVSHIAFCLTRMPDLQTLNLTWNQIGSAMGDLCHVLQNLTKLVKLYLSSTCLSEDNISHLVSCLTCMPDLQTLHLSHNQIGRAMGDLCHGLQHLTKLRTLNLDDTGLMDDGISMLPLAHLTELRELNISGFGFNQEQYGPQGVEHLFRNLHHVRHLNVLSLHYREGWLERNEFLRECYQVPKPSSSVTLWLDRKNIKSIVKLSEIH